MNDNSDMSGAESGVLIRVMVIRNKLGFHARPAAMFAKVASRFDCDITIAKGDTKVSGKSVMGLLGLEAGHGTKITVAAEGPDARDALDQLQELMESGFGHHDGE